jgi:hypothetical protein
MSRFANSGTFRYAPAADSFSGALTTITLDAGQLPQYPFANQSITDRVTYRSKNGKSWMYENYNLDSFTFRWTLLDEPTKTSLRTMYDAKGLVNFCSGTNNFGTFRIANNTWKDEEVAFELYDLEFTLEEAGV